MNSHSIGKLTYRHKLVCTDRFEIVVRIEVFGDRIAVLKPEPSVPCSNAKQLVIKSLLALQQET